MTTTTLSDQINALVAENRRLRNKSTADDITIQTLTEQYERLQSGVEDMVEDHRRRERELIAAADRAERAYVSIQGLLDQAADLILQAARARVGDAMPAPVPHLTDSRMPGVALS